MSKDNTNTPEGQQALIEKLQAEGSNSAEFTKEEKLALVASELMAPEEVGLPNAEAAKLELMPDAKIVPKLGDALGFKCGVVPLALRAKWAYDDTKIILADSDQREFMEEFVEKNKNTFRIQGEMHCGTTMGKFERTFSDPIIGICEMLRLCADNLEKLYTGENTLPVTDINEPPQIQA